MTRFPFQENDVEGNPIKPTKPIKPPSEGVKSVKSVKSGHPENAVSPTSNIVSLAAYRWRRLRQRRSA